MDPDDCKTFQDHLAKYCAWTQKARFEARAPPFHEKTARALYELYCDMQWQHLQTCDSCRNLDSYTVPCLRYEAAMWMNLYTRDCWENDRRRFMARIDPVIKVVVRNQQELDEQLVEHARACPRHRHEHDDLQQVYDETMAATQATLEMLSRLQGINHKDVH